ncbi:aldose 1-epimerase [Dysgonomonadaceae bacterium PH5-43]|nr:aldose 1-epimerase [Dysgonomonadaceae bacterium PH5-43]
MIMKKILLTLATGLLLISCGGDKNKQEFASGLAVTDFEQSTEQGTNQLFVIKNTKGMEVSVINIGARIIAAMVPDKSGNLINVVDGYKTLEPYLNLKDYKGAVLGRYAGRISGGEISLDRVTYRLRTNESTTMFNGGPRGFSSRYFNIEQPDESTLVCNYFSTDKKEEGGLPGNLDVTVTYKVTEDNSIDIAYEATVSRATYINLTNNMPFNLSGAEVGAISDYSLLINAPSYIEVNEDKIPTGKILPVKGDFDFTSSKEIDTTKAYDVMYALNTIEGTKSLAAKLSSASTGVNVEVYTTEPGIQLYTASDKPVVVMQTQHFPDSPHQESFPTTILRKDSTYYSNTIYKFGLN